MSPKKPQMLRPIPHPTFIQEMQQQALRPRLLYTRPETVPHPLLFIYRLPCHNHISLGHHLIVRRGLCERQARVACIERLLNQLPLLLSLPLLLEHRLTMDKLYEGTLPMEALLRFPLLRRWGTGAHESHLQSPARHRQQKIRRGRAQLHASLTIKMPSMHHPPLCIGARHQCMAHS